MACYCVCLDCAEGRHCGGAQGHCLEPADGIWSDDFNRDFYGLDDDFENYLAAELSDNYGEKDEDCA